MFIEKENSFIKKSGRKLDKKRIEWVTLDSYYFTEYWIEFWNAILNFFKKNQKWEKLLLDLISNDLSLRWKWMAAVASFLWYSLDKVFNIFISLKDKHEFIKITTIDEQSIEVTDWMYVLTRLWYKKACEIDYKDEIMIVIGSSFSFKTWSENWNNIVINDILNKLAIKFWKRKKIHISELKWEEKKLVYLIWFKTCEKWMISVEDLKKAQKFFSEKKKKVNWNIKNNKISNEEELEEDNETELLWLTKLFKNNQFGYKLIKSIEKIEKTNIVVFNINTHVSENLIINNFIIKQNS